jgi:hypothetical protein
MGMGNAMIPVPELTGLDVAFGNIKHLPKREDLPEDFRKNWHSDSNPWCHAISQWFYNGAKSTPNGIEIDGVMFNVKPGVDKTKALAAIKAALGSFEPQHEHKIGGCGYLLSQWFDMKKKKTA